MDLTVNDAVEQLRTERTINTMMKPRNKSIDASRLDLTAVGLDPASSAAMESCFFRVDAAGLDDEDALARSVTTSLSSFCRLEFPGNNGVSSAAAGMMPAVLGQSGRLPLRS